MSAGSPDHKHIRLGERDADKAMADRAVIAHLEKPKRFDNSYDLPYLAGYSKDGRTIFFDRHLPKLIRVGKSSIDPRKFLKVHESVEKALIDVLKFSYDHAHEVATHEENAAVRKAGLVPSEYELAVKPFIKADEREKLTRVPPTLDLTPYQGDTRLLARMRSAVR